MHRMLAEFDRDATCDLAAEHDPVGVEYLELAELIESLGRPGFCRNNACERVLPVPQQRRQLTVVSDVGDRDDLLHECRREWSQTCARQSIRTEPRSVDEEDLRGV